MKKNSLFRLWNRLWKRIGPSLVVQWLGICQCRGQKFNPRSEKIPHASGPLSPHTVFIAPMLPSKRNHGSEKPHTTAKCGPHLLQLERPRAATETQHSQKLKPILKSRSLHQSCVHFNFDKYSQIFLCKNRTASTNVWELFFYVLEDTFFSPKIANNISDHFCP